MEPKKLSTLAIDLLHQELKKTAHGAIRDAESSFGFERNTLGNMRTNRDGKLSTFLALASASKRHPADIVTEVFGEDLNPVDWLFKGFTERPRLVESLGSRISERIVDLGHLNAVALKIKSHPDEALGTLEEMAMFAPSSLHSELLGLYGSALRTKHQIRDAHCHLAWSYDFAKTNSESAKALQRLAYVLNDLAKPRLGLIASREAEHRFFLDGDLDGASQCLVDQAVCHFVSSKFSKAGELYSLALDKHASRLPENNIVACLQGLGRVYRELGDTENALKLSQMANAYHLDPHSKAKVLWLEGATLLEEVPEQGVALFEQAIDLLATCSPVEAALAALELVDRAGSVNPDRAAAIARESARLIGPLRDSPYAEQIISQLVLSGCKHMDSAAFQGEVRGLLEKLKKVWRNSTATLD